jgi:hypothetical protein
MKAFHTFFLTQNAIVDNFPRTVAGLRRDEGSPSRQTELSGYICVSLKHLSAALCATQVNETALL